jgi:ribosomal protein S18 acetylase RimI-like enzyme
MFFLGIDFRNLSKLAGSGGTSFAKEGGKRSLTMSVISEVISRVLKVRSMVAADLPRLLQLEKQPLGSRLLRHALPVSETTDDRGIWVATIQNAVVGYLIFQVFTDHDSRGADALAGPAEMDEDMATALPVRVEILHMFVAPDWRRQGIGRALVERFDPRPFQKPGCRIQVAVPETMLPVQLLLRAGGFKAVRVLRQHFISEDAYLMERTTGRVDP